MMKPAVTDQVVDYAPSQSDCDDLLLRRFKDAQRACTAL